MSDTVSYTRVNWKNKETALTTPINATNLNKMDKGIDDLKNAVNTLTTDVVAIKVVNSENDLPDPGAANTIYFVKQTN